MVPRISFLSHGIQTHSLGLHVYKAFHSFLHPLRTAVTGLPHEHLLGDSPWWPEVKKVILRPGDSCPSVNHGWKQKFTEYLLAPTALDYLSQS